MKDIDKILVTKPTDIKSVDDMEIYLNDLLCDFGTGQMSKKDALENIVELVIHMMQAAKGKVPFKREN